MTEIQPGLWVANRSTSIFAPPELASRLVNGLREQVATLTRERDEYRAGCQEWNEKYESWRLVAGEARAAALQRERDEAEATIIAIQAQFSEAITQRDRALHRLGPIDPGGGDRIDELESAADFLRHRAETAEVAIVSLQADYKGLELQLFDVSEALDGQFPSQEPCVARAVQQQREALDRVQDELRTLQAQIQAITQEMREASWCSCPCHVSPFACNHGTCLECCDGSPLKWADVLDAAGKGDTK